MPTASNRTWKLTYGSRPVFLWHRVNEPGAGTGAVWDDVNRRVTREEIGRIAATVHAPSVPWPAILASWSPLPAEQVSEQAIYGRALTSGARCGD